MSLTQAYLSTAISTLENASEILKEIHSLAVLGANGSNSTQDNQFINLEAEALADAFHKSMTAAHFKGKEIFVDEVSSSVLSAGGRSSEVNFGVGKVDYDLFYDYDNPALNTLDAGIKYQISFAVYRPLLSNFNWKWEYHSFLFFFINIFIFCKCKSVSEYSIFLKFIEEYGAIFAKEWIK